VSNYFLDLESCHIKKKAFYSSLGHSSPVVQSTDSRQPFVCLHEQSSTCSSSRCRSRRSSHFRC